MDAPQQNKEQGQSILIIAFIVVILLALVALVVDVGNAYAQRRVVQNAVDAAVMAGVRRLAEHNPNGSPAVVVREVHVYQAIRDYAEDNGLDPDHTQGFFIDNEGNRLPGAAGLIEQNFFAVPASAKGVEVVGKLPFNTYFAQLLGFDILEASTFAKGWVLRGPCDGDNLFPLTVASSAFAGEPGGVPQVNKTYSLWEHGSKLAPGNWGWLFWQDGDGVVRGEEPPNQNSSTNNLSANMLDPSRSGHWYYDDWVHGSTGVDLGPFISDNPKKPGELNQRVQGAVPDSCVTIPIYSSVEGTGNNTVFQIEAFGQFCLTCVMNAKNDFVERNPGDCNECTSSSYAQNGSNSDKCISGYFRQTVIPRMTDGCMNTGILAPSFRQPKPTPSP